GAASCARGWGGGGGDWYGGGGGGGAAPPPPGGGGGGGGGPPLPASFRSPTSPASGRGNRSEWKGFGVPRGICRGVVPRSDAWIRSRCFCPRPAGSPRGLLRSPRC